jgi:hypothetical protein
VGNPGSTFRLETLAQMNFRGTVREPALYRLFVTRREALQRLVDATGDEAVRNAMFSLGNAEKAYRGFVETLEDPYIIARIQDAEEDFQAAIETDPQLDAAYGDLHEQMAAIQEEKLALEDEYSAFLIMQPGAPYGSVTLQRAMVAYDYLQRQAEGASEEQLAPLRQQLANLADLPEGVDAAYLAQRLTDFRFYLGEEDAVVESALGDQEPAAAAEAILSGTVLGSQAAAQEALADGTLSMDDPAVELVAAFMPRYRDYRSAIQGLQAQEEELGRQLGRARYEVYGTDVPPDATFSLRLADGIVQSYEYNGTVAPIHTTFEGLYDRYHAHGGEGDWDLPARWLNPPESFDRMTPYNFISTNDIVGGNSGSPVVNRALELVGVAFDGNIESLSGRYIYRTDGPRTVSVDALGMLEALDEIYDADRLVIELMTGELIETEEQADAATTSDAR